VVELPGTDRLTSMLMLFLDAQSRRAQLAAGNIANADTPGYLAKELDFSEQLRRAAYDTPSPGSVLIPTTGLRMPNTVNALYTGGEQPELLESVGNALSIDGNTVDMGHEMAVLGDAGMQYLAGVQLLQAHFRALQTAIREGK
jgi:flagellar basal-body rod protein FlgB